MKKSTKKIDHNSIVNQNIKSKFVSIHVYSNVNSMVEYILRTAENSGNDEAPFTYDDIENYYSYPEYIGEYANFQGGSDEERQEEIERLQEISNSLIDTDGKKFQKDRNIHELISEEIEELENLESEPQEIFEWWIVSDFLGRKLKSMGHPMINDEYWGRCTTGQAILLDNAISEICEGMEILEGQTNSWAK